MLYNFLNKNGQLIALLTGAIISVIFILMVMSSASTEGLDADSFTNLTGAALQERLASLTQFDFGLYVTYFLTIATAAVAVLYGLYHFVMQIVDSPKSAFRTLVVIVGLFVIFLIAYFTAPQSSTSVAKVEEVFEVSGGQSQFIGGAINATIVLSILSLVALVVFEIRNLFK